MTFKQTPERVRYLEDSFQRLRFYFPTLVTNILRGLQELRLVFTLRRVNILKFERKIGRTYFRTGR